MTAATRSNLLVLAVVLLGLALDALLVLALGRWSWRSGGAGSGAIPVATAAGDLDDLIVNCATCHGPQGHGRAELGAPAIAGQEPWYLELQLRAFREGWRGTHPADTWGRTMAPIAVPLDDAQIAALAAHFAALPSLAQPDRGRGDATRGAELYGVCMACHGFQGEGNEYQHAPRLTNQHAWYLERQLANYNAGRRGTHPDDQYGQIMRPMAGVLKSPQDISDVVAHILTLEPLEDAPPE